MWRGIRTFALRIRYTFGHVEKVFDAADQVVLGRPKDGVVPDIDLTPDRLVSRPHARISRRDGEYWIEDLGSANGTRVDETPIPPRTPVQLLPGQQIRISNTTLVVEESEEADNDSTLVPYGTLMPTYREPVIDEVIDATAVAFDQDHPIDASRAQHIALLYELPLRLGEQSDLDTLLQVMIEQLVTMLPSASRGALLLTDPSSELLLKAHVPIGNPAVSITLARRAIVRKQGFIWSRQPRLSVSQIANGIEAGMYVPLIYKDTVVGVACVDNSDEGGNTFSIDDLRMMMAAAHHAALAVTQNKMQEELRQNTALLSRLMTNFSPETRNHLLNQARNGRLRLGGQRSEVVILMSDIRHFTQLTTNMEADEIVDLLNDYFSALVDAIFKYDGTIDKYVGDAILAVFGSPEPDEKRHEKAVHAALAMQTAASAVTEKRQRQRLATCEIGIGLHCGPVLHGFIGSPERMELTIIGDAVNWTQRYTDGAGPSEIVISTAMYERIWRWVDTESKSITTKHDETLTAYRLRGLKTQTRKRI
jgi:adenylate cyclase